MVRLKANDYAASQGWQRAPDVEKLNRGRTVYQDPDTGKLFSVDTQHGHLEILNDRGKHQGSIDLWGHHAKGPDASGRHNLRTR